MTRKVWTPEAIRALGVLTDVETAGNILGMGRTVAYREARSGAFPVKVINSGGKMSVPVQPILELLGIREPAPMPTA